MPCDFLKRGRDWQSIDRTELRCQVPIPSDPVDLCFFDTDEELREWEHCAAYWAEWYRRSRRANESLLGKLHKLGLRVYPRQLTWPTSERIREQATERSARHRAVVALREAR